MFKFASTIRRGMEFLCLPFSDFNRITFKPIHSRMRRDVNPHTHSIKFLRPKSTPDHDRPQAPAILIWNNESQPIRDKPTSLVSEPQPTHPLPSCRGKHRRPLSVKKPRAGDPRWSIDSLVSALRAQHLRRRVPRLCLVRGGQSRRLLATQRALWRVFV